MITPQFQEGTAWPGASSDDGPEPGLGEIATFTTDDGGYPSQYNVTINWGDGTASSSGTVIDDPASPNEEGLYVYDIYSAHTYRNAGDDTIMVSIQDSVDDTTAATTPNEGQVTVAPQTLTPANPQPTVNAVVGTPLNDVGVATFQSANPEALPSDFTATILWGDGSSSGTLVEDSSGVFHVEGSHTYTSDPADGYEIAVDVVHTGTDSSLIVDNTPTISPALLELSPSTVTVSDASIQSGASVIPAGTVIGTFTDEAGAAPSSDYTSAASYVQFPGAAVNGGGNTNTPIAIDPLVANGSTYTLETAAATTFASPLLPGTQPFSILIENTADGAIVQGTSSLVVTDAPLGLPANGQPSLSATTRGTSDTATVAAFTDPDTLALPSEFTATIKWGDGTTSTGTVTEVTSPNPNVVMFDVQGTHTYTTTGAFSVAVDVQGLVSSIQLSNPNPVEVNGASLTVPSPSLSISDASIDGSGQSYIPAGTVVGTFTDTGGADPATDYTGAGSYASFTGSLGNTPILVAPVVTGSSTFTVTTAASTVFSTALAPGTVAYSLQITNTDGDVSQSAAGMLTVTDAPLGVPVSGQPLIPGQVRGSGFTATLAAFTDPNTLAAPGDFTASINWGDGSTSAGTITGSAGSFHVQGTHTYATVSPAGGFPISVSIEGVSPFTASLSPSNYVTVTGSALQLSAVPVNLSDASIDGSNQAYIPSGTVVGTFTDTGGADTASNYTAAGSYVSFPGAGSSTPLSVSLSGTTFTVTTAADTVISPRLVPGSETFQLQVTNTDGNMSAAASGTLTVSDAPLSPPGGGQTTVTATRGTAFTTTAAAFSDPDTLAAASDFTAIIHWGDTSSTIGTIVKAAPGSFLVEGSHTYSTAGSLSITVDVQGLVSTIELDNSATVLGAPLQLSASPVTVSDESINGSDQPHIAAGTLVGSFTDTGGADPSADYTGAGSSISFAGADSPTPVAVSPVSIGSPTFLVTTAADTIMSDPMTPGNTSFTLQITNTDGNIGSSANGVLTVTDAPLQDPPGPATIPIQVRGTSFTAAVATFTAADVLIPAGDFTASINWGDGDSSAGTISGSNGSFQVQGTHTYSSVSPAGGFPISVSIEGVSPYTAALSLSNSVVVTGSSLQVSAVPVNLSDASINGFEQSIIPAGTVVGTFIDTGGAGPAASYTGAGSYVSFPGGTGNTPLSISLSGSTFTVATATDTVILPRLVPGTGTFLLQVTSTSEGVAASSSGTLTIADATMGTPSGGQPSIADATLDTGFTAEVGAFTDGDPLATVSDFTATINWGDGTAPTPGVITETSGGVFLVAGTHAYSVVGREPIAVTVSDHWGASIPLSDAVTVNAPAIAIAGQLNPARDTGISSFDAITGDTQPNFFGTTGAFASVSLYAQAPGTSAVLIGHTTANAGGAWSITSATLAQGSYTIFATAVDPYGQSQATTQLLPDAQQGPLVIETTGPTVEGVSFNRSMAQVTITFQDNLASLDQASLLTLGNYRVSKRYAQSGTDLVTSVSTSNPAGPAGPETVTLQLKNGRPIAKGLYFLSIAAGGIEDAAGIPLNGLFTGSFPTGYGQSDSNFVAEFSAKSRTSLISGTASPAAVTRNMSSHAASKRTAATKARPAAVVVNRDDSRLDALDRAIDAVGGSSNHHHRR